MKPVLKILPLIVALTLLTACNNQPPLSVNQMVDVLFDVYRFEGTVSQINYNLSSEKKVQYYNYIFAKHNTTKEQFDESLKWYAEHPAEWDQVYMSLEEKGLNYAELVKNKDLPELKEQKRHAVTTDTFDMWTSREKMYWYDDLVCEVDSQRIGMDKEGSRYFVGTRRLELTARVRVVSKNDTENVLTQLVLHYPRRDCDTFSVKIPCDSLWHRVKISTGRIKGNVSRLELQLVDNSMFSNLKSFEYEDLALRNIYDKNSEHIERRLIDDISFSRSRKYEKQTSCNVKRAD